MNRREELKHIFKFHDTIPDRIISRESNTLEFKESFNWNSKDKYGCTVAAFSNNRGGYIVFGVKNQPRDLVGLLNDNFDNLDESKIAEFLNSIFSPEILFEKYLVNVNTKKVGIFHIIQNPQKPVVCIKNSGDLQEAVIYYRYNARSEKIKYPELKALLEKIQSREKESWMEHFERISKIGAENALILDTIEGKIEGHGGTLVIDEKLLPKLNFIKEGHFAEKDFPTLKLIGDVKPITVIPLDKRGKLGTDIHSRITSDPNAPEVRIEEENLLREYSLSYNDLTKTLCERYADFIRNNNYHRIRKKICEKPGYKYTRHLNPKNPKSTRQDFYHPRIIEEFEKHYTIKVK
jgi:hypothetical protein